MAKEVELKVDFAGVELSSPVFTVSGTCGYADELAEFMGVGALGGFITKTITLKPRDGNAPPRIVETDAGMLNAIGLANIGLEAFIADKISALAQMSASVFVSVAGETAGEYAEIVERLAGEEAIDGFELNISCPNVAQGGLNFGTDAAKVAEITSAASKCVGTKVLMVKLSPCVTDIAEPARAAVENGATALSLVNTFTGLAIDVESGRCVLGNGTGGLSGPAIKPMALYLVNKVYRQVARDYKIPILGIGGIRTAQDALEFIISGASAVGVGTASFIEPDCSIKIIDGIQRYCLEKDIADISELTGTLEGLR